MEELLKNEDVRKKIKCLSPEIRKAFIESLLDLFEQETEDMIDAIEESRMELRGTMLDFEDETEQLRAESRMLEQQRNKYEKQCVDDYLEKKGRKSRTSSRAMSRVSYVNERDTDRNRETVLNYIRQKDNRKRVESRSASSLSVPSIHSPDDRPSSVQSSRSLPTPVMSRKTIEEETNEIMQNFTSVDMKMETERHRQAELLEKRRQEKAKNRKTTEEKALELLEKALFIDKQLAAKKEQQNQKLQERLEEMKKKKEEERSKSRSSESRTHTQYVNQAYEQDLIIEKY